MSWKVAVSGHRKSGPQAGNAIFSYTLVAESKSFRSWVAASDYALKKHLEDPPYYDVFFNVDGSPKEQEEPTSRPNIAVVAPGDKQIEAPLFNIPCWVLATVARSCHAVGMCGRSVGFPLLRYSVNPGHARKLTLRRPWSPRRLGSHRWDCFWFRHPTDIWCRVRAARGLGFRVVSCMIE
ncbi:PFP-BETA1 [Symbiodinium necroappetens]|uniref:PFP-BETA1 protein n=1 Tax=Symbiodinium necroappetens TaxID=1628268 RepID=A0A813CC79_9DINO|nr:PFP-BETA1 [Symbiodinium necroappetens]